MNAPQHKIHWQLTLRVGAVIAVLGLAEGATWDVGELTVGPHDRLILATDGLPETVSPAGALFGRERLHASLQASASDPLDRLPEHILAELTDYRGSGSQTDDLTMLVVDFT